MTTGTLFISDGSISNPIVQSQGIPLLAYLAEKGNTCVFLSIEKSGDDNNYQKIVDEIKIETSPKIIFKKIIQKENPLLPSWFLFIVNGVRGILSLIDKYNIGILHARSFFPSVLGLIIKQIFRRKIKLLYDNRGLFIEEEIRKGHWKSTGIKVRCFRHIEKCILKKTDAVVVVSAKFKEYLLIQHQKSINDLDERIYIITNRTKLFPVSEEQLIVKRNPGRTVITYSGSAAAWQSLKEMKKLFCACIDVFPDSEFHIISYNKSDFIDLFKNTDVLSRIRFIEAKSSEVFYHLVKCDFGILLREHDPINNVASPLKFAEYLAAGLPVLISEGVGDFSRLVIEKNVGVVINNSDYEKALLEMKSLIENSDIYKRCRTLAEEEFDIKISFKQYEDIYNSLN